MTVALFKWTVDRYHAAIDAGLFEDQAVELLRGDIIVMAPEREPHACYSSVGAEYLRLALGERASVREGKPIRDAQVNKVPTTIALIGALLRECTLQ
jgi:Uma2 family endonuclease